MAVIDTLSLLLTANSEPMRKELDKAGNAVKGFKKQFGEESSFGLFGKLLKGGGVVGGLTLAFAGIEKLVTGFDELDRRVQRAGGSWRDYVREIGRSIPVVSQTAAILDVLTGQVRRNQDMVAYANDAIAAAEALKQFHRGTGEAVNAMAELIAANEKALRLGSVFGVDREALQIAMDAEAQLAKIAEQHKKVRAASLQLLEAQKAIFAFTSVTGGMTAEQLGEQQKRMIEAITRAATEGVERVRVQKLGDVLSGVAADAISGGIKDGIESAERDLRNRRIMQGIVGSVLQGAIAGLESGREQMREIDRPGPAFSGLEDSGIATASIARELATAALGGRKDPVQQQIADDVRVMKEKLEAPR